MKNLNGVSEINGYKVLTLHGSITEKNKEGFNIFVDFNKQELTFSGFALMPETLRKVADLLDMVPKQEADKAANLLDMLPKQDTDTERVTNDKPTAPQPKKKAAPKRKKA